MSDPGADQPGAEDQPAPLSPLPREEYVEQRHLFRTMGEQIRENVPAQDMLAGIREEVLATTKLPMAIDFMLAELRHLGTFSTAMQRLGHYFTPFQCYVTAEAEDDRRRFDMRIALEILAREAEYRAQGISRQGLFLYQLEALSRNRLGYDRGLEAIAGDPSYDQAWREWILTVRRQIGLVETADLIYVRSEYYRERAAALSLGEESPAEPEVAVLFGRREGRIAWANRRKDPLYLFAALHRQLGYPEVPRPRAEDPEERLLPVLARRIELLESRLKLVEDEQRGGFDLTKFYQKPPEPPAERG
ncbi:MAG: hypothetical protein KF688_16770 [Pirellulales bacterium]|nr:hypothetical protein [Pirellulales bacterium]